RPPHQGRRQGLRARRICRLFALQGQEGADRLRGAGGRPAGFAAGRRRGRQGAPSGGGAAPGRLDDVAARPDVLPELSRALLRLGQEGRAADAGRQPARRVQAPVPDQGHRRPPRQPPHLQQGKERHARPVRGAQTMSVQTMPAQAISAWRLRLPPLTTQTFVGLTVAIVTAAFVLYPIYYLVQASLDVGDPDVRPPSAYGFDNFAQLPDY